MPVSAKMKRRRGNHLQPGFLTPTNARRGMKKCDLRQEACPLEFPGPRTQAGAWVRVELHYRNQSRLARYTFSRALNTDIFC
uniref:Uncharacterized protein n=1 Tax=Candidatus Kentrum sp. LPFa TaxID=2126335 RepID=A0A450WHB3_9GAMM|nr:MAG: hypothetical protein BECKLPF1236A_GA0070988_101458 [Candidatus Kentron sp. LPFa]